MMWISYPFCTLSTGNFKYVVRLCCQNTVCLVLWLIFLLLLQKSSQLEMGTEQSSQISKSGGLEHSNELQKVNLWYFSKAAVNSGSWG